MTEENRPRSEMWKEAADDWNDKDAAARMLEETKSLIFAQKCAELGSDIPVNRAEQTVKASKDWYEKVVGIVDSRTIANAARIEMEYREKKYREYMNEEYNHRVEAKL